MALPDRIDAPYTPPPPPVEQPGEKQHTVQPGENLDTIAVEHRTTQQAILDINPQVRDPSLLATGEVLNIPDATVDPALAGVVESVLPAGATPEQRNEANVRVQDYVDAQGGIGDSGIAQEALAGNAVNVPA